MAAHVDVETWKRRTGILQLRLASLQEDVDMYVMRVQLLDSEIGKQCSEKALAQASTHLKLRLALESSAECLPQEHHQGAQSLEHCWADWDLVQYVSTVAVDLAISKHVTNKTRCHKLRDEHLHAVTGRAGCRHF